MANKVEKISEALALIEAKLIEAVGLLDQSNRVAVEQTSSIDGMRISDPKGNIFVAYLSGKHKPKDLRNNCILNDRDLVVGVFPFIRYFDNGMKPSDYVDFVNEALSGIEIENTRAEYQRKIYPIDDSLIEENNGEWKYMVRFGVPIDFIEKSLRN